MKIQELWLTGAAWDDNLPEEIVVEWLEYRTKLTELYIRIPRWISTTSTQQHIEVHGFCDALMKAYAAVVYIRTTDDTGNVAVHLLTAKSRVAPLKSISLPRLELQGALLLAKLMQKVVEAMHFKNVQRYACSDSMIVLAWLKGHPNRYTTFVANRVAEIQEITDSTIWKHVPSEFNPADCATRGVSPNELQNHHLWWVGPPWLKSPLEEWPVNKNVPSTSLEMKTIQNLNATVNHSETNDLLYKYSSLDRLVRITAYCFRFKRNSLPQSTNITHEWLTAKELKDSRNFWIRFVQHLEFSQEIYAIKNEKKILRRSPILKLNPFLCTDNLLRVGGKLRNSALSYNEKHPIIIPSKHHLSNLLIDECHIKTLHGGVQLMMGNLQRQFWIIDGRSTINRRIHKCIKCFRQRAKGQVQLMADLPKARVSISRPITNSSVEYCGPIDIKLSKGRSPKTSKAYIAVFVCLAVKAVHLELVSDLTAEAFLAAFRRFTARRGTIKNMYSDNGSNFVGANTILRNVYKQCQQQYIASLENSGVNWHFIPPAAPHFGGLWEAGVKSTKAHVKKVIGSTKLTFKEMATLLTQIEGCLNSRPLCPITNDPNDYTALTPGHFIAGNAILAPPEPCLLDVKQHRLNRWQYIQQMQQIF